MEILNTFLKLIALASGVYVIMSQIEYFKTKSLLFKSSRLLTGVIICSVLSGGISILIDGHLTSKAQSDSIEELKNQRETHKADEHIADSRHTNDSVNYTRQNNELRNIIDGLIRTSNKTLDTSIYSTVQNNALKDSISVLQRTIEGKDMTIIDKNLAIASLQSQISDIKDYAYISVFDMNGNNGEVGLTPMVISSDLIIRMNKILLQKNGMVYVRTDNSIMPLIDSVIILYPKYPFGYWAKYSLLKLHKDKGWRIYAERALDILKKTTTIDGHSQDHDQLLKRVISDLNDKD